MSIVFRYILKEHLSPFFFGLAVTTFILLLDFLVRVLNLVISKGVSLTVVGELFAMNMASILALSIPMSVLVATLMAFGRLSGDNEVTAFKACGISPLALMRPMFYIAVLLSGLMIYFHGYVVPEAVQETRNLINDIKRKRPSVALTGGLFLESIPGYSMYVRSVDANSDSLRGVMIFDGKDRVTPRVVVAERGHVSFADQGNTMVLNLFDGEIHEPDPAEYARYRKISFERQIMRITDLGVTLERTSNLARGNREMTFADLGRTVTGFDVTIAKFRADIRQVIKDGITEIQSDAVTRRHQLGPPNSDLSAIRRVRDRNLRIKAKIDGYCEELERQKNYRNRYAVEIHRRVTIPLTCLLFFLLGAPVGILSRRGGIVMGVGMSIGFFLVYWIFLIAGEQLAMRGLVPLVPAVWAGNVLLLGVGVWLTWLSVHDSTYDPTAIFRVLASWAGRIFTRGSKTVK